LLNRIADDAIGSDGDHEDHERKARTLIEKKTVVNLLSAYAVAVKHHLRREDGIYYEDLHPLVCFLPTNTSPTQSPRLRPANRASTTTTNISETKFDEESSARGNAFQAHLVISVSILVLYLGDDCNASLRMLTRSVWSEKTKYTYGNLFLFGTHVSSCA
jgi:hypothetical protein